MREWCGVVVVVVWRGGGVDGGWMVVVVCVCVCVCVCVPARASVYAHARVYA